MHLGRKRQEGSVAKAGTSTLSPNKTKTTKESSLVSVPFFGLVHWVDRCGRGRKTTTRKTIQAFLVSPLCKINTEEGGGGISICFHSSLQSHPDLCNASP